MNESGNPSSLLFWSIVLAYAARGFFQQKSEIQELQQNLEKEKVLRSAERRGRIKLQQTQRDQIQQQDRTDGYAMKPIGVVQSQYPDRRYIAAFTVRIVCCCMVWFMKHNTSRASYSGALLGSRTWYGAVEGRSCLISSSFSTSTSRS